MCVCPYMAHVYTLMPKPSSLYEILKHTETREIDPAEDVLNKFPFIQYDFGKNLLANILTRI